MPAARRAARPSRFRAAGPRNWRGRSATCCQGPLRRAAPACATTFRPMANSVTSSMIGQSMAAKARPAPVAIAVAAMTAEASDAWSSPDVPPFTVRRDSARMTTPGEPKRLSMKLCRTLALGLAVALVALTGPRDPLAAQDGFIAGVEDLPLMPGLSEVADAAWSSTNRPGASSRPSPRARSAARRSRASTRPPCRSSAGVRSPTGHFSATASACSSRVREGADGVTVEYRLAPE